MTWQQQSVIDTFHLVANLTTLASPLRCKKHEVPLEKAYNKTQREKFAWAVDMADKDFVF